MTRDEQIKKAKSAWRDGKRQFTCPSPFATFDDCVANFEGDLDIDDAEAFCASWKDECGEASRNRPTVERRMVTTGGLRVLDDSPEPRFEGYAIVFDSISEDLGFREVIRSSAVDRTLRESLDVRALINHDPSLILGRTKAGTLRMRKDSHGLKVTIFPPDTQVARDLAESVKRGDVSGMSFAFSLVDEESDDVSMVDGTVVREIKDMRMSDVSIVTYPAYPATDVSVAKRMLDERLARASINQWRLRRAERLLKLEKVR